MKWTKYLIISISVVVLILSDQIIKACTDFNYYDTYTQFFGNQAPDKLAYRPFYFIEEDNYYGENLWDGRDAKEVADSINKALTISEWQSFLKNGIPAAEIDSLLYEGTVHTFEQIKEGEEEEHGALAQYLKQKKHQQVLDYFLYAKKCEVNARVNEEVWPEEKKAQQPMATNETLMESGLQKIKTVKDPFLRKKYIFQVLRMAFYDKEYQKVLNLYDQLAKGDPDQSVASTRILGFRAGVYYHLDNKPQAGYYYTKMFDNSNAYKLEAMTSFDWSMHYHGEHYFDSIYALCQSDHERAVALVMKGLRTLPLDLNDIQKAYKLDPEVDGIAVLINREINKLEKLYFSKKVYAKNQLEDIRPYYISESRPGLDSLDLVYQPHIHALRDFVRQLMVDKKAGDPALWHLVQAYLACMQNEPAEMKNQLNSAQKAGMSKHEKTVYNIVDLLYTLYKNPAITAEMEKELLPKLKQLNHLAKASVWADHQFRDMMENLVAGKYFQQGDTIKGIFAMAHAVSYAHNRSNFYADVAFEDRQGTALNRMSVADLKKVIAFREGDFKTAYEQWLVHKTYYSPAVLKELEATKYIRQRDFKKATELLTKVGEKVDPYGYPDPFMPHISDAYHLEHQDTIRTYTKLSFSRRMAELQQVIAKKPNDAGALYGYAVALYNISYYGKSADITNYLRHTTDRKAYFKRSSDAKRPQYLQEYYGVREAEQYFLKAAKAAQDPELKAKALWGAAKCWTKRCPISKEGEEDYYYWRYTKGDSTYYHHALQSPYFEKLKTHLIQTQFVQKARGTCDYFSDYIRQD